MPPIRTVGSIACFSRVGRLGHPGTAAEVMPLSEIARWRFTPDTISNTPMDDYTAAVMPKGKAAAA